MSRAALARLVAGCVAIASLTAFLSIGGTPWVARLLAQARERVLYVSVVESATEQPVRDLTADAFVVREDGVRREVLRAAPASSPMALAIVVDNSQAAAATIPDLRRGLTAFLNTIQGLGPTALVTVADRPTIVVDYTTGQDELLGGVGRLFHSPNSGATLLDAIVEVSKGIGRREEDRAGIVVVTTENVDFSHFSYIDVLKALDQSGASLHVVVLVNPEGSYATDEARNRSTVLDRGPRESGGLRMDVLTSMSYEPRLRDLGAILTSQYRVVYARPDALLPPEKVEVAAARPGLEARGAPARGQGER